MFCTTRPESAYSGVEVRRLLISYAFWIALTVLAVWLGGKLKRALLRQAKRLSCGQTEKSNANRFF
jgi:hypothetical protein